MPRDDKKSIKHDKVLVAELQNPELAIAYLNAALEESLTGSEESQKLFLLAFKDVAEAKGGVGKLAKKAQVGRESLYKTLSETGNPRLNTLIALCRAMDLKIKITS